MVSVAVRAPAAPGAGEKVTMTLHDPPLPVTENPVVQVVPVVTILKSLAFVPLFDTEEIETAVNVAFVRVTYCCPLVVLIRVPGNVSAVGLTLTTELLPLPDSLSLGGHPPGMTVAG